MKKLIITEEEKQRIRKSYGLDESLPDLDTFPVGGNRYDIGWDQKLQDKLNKGDTSFDSPTHNTDFSKVPTYAGAGGHLKGHRGVDIFGPKGTPILAPVSGKVVYNNSNGNTIIIEDPETGFSHWLGHLDSRTVENGKFVLSGEQVGTLGDSGNAQGTTPHLHYNIYKTSDGFYSGEDPINVLKKSIGKKSSYSFQDYFKKLFGSKDSNGENKIKADDELDLWSMIKKAGTKFISDLFV